MDKIQTSFGIKYSMEGTRRLMRRLGFRHVSPRAASPWASAVEMRRLGFRHVSPRPLQAKPEDQEKFRENFQDKDAVGSDKTRWTIEIWF